MIHRRQFLMKLAMAGTADAQEPKTYFDYVSSAFAVAEVHTADKPLEFRDRQMLPLSDGHIAEVMDVGALEDFPVSLSQPSAQLVFARKDPVFRESAELDVPVQDHDLMASFRHNVGHRYAGRTRPNHHH